MAMQRSIRLGGPKLTEIGRLGDGTEQTVEAFVE